MVAGEPKPLTMKKDSNFDSLLVRSVLVLVYIII